MSETVHYKGVLKKVEKIKGETLEEQCKRILGNKELPSYFDDYKEFLSNEKYEEYTILEDDVYRVIKERIDPDFGVYNASIGENGEINFEVRYYNGGCSFDEAIREALENIKE